MNLEYDEEFELEAEKAEEKTNRKRHSKSQFILKMLTVFLCLLIITVIGMVAITLYGKDLFMPQSTEKPERVYSREEVEAMLEQAQNDALLKEAEAKVLGREEILTEIKDSLINGNGTLDTIKPYFPDDIIIVSSGRYIFSPIRDDIAHNDFKIEDFAKDNKGAYSYIGENHDSFKGIDVSKFQGKIDWEKVKKDGVDFAIIRAGYRGYGKEGKLVEDETFTQNVKGATKAGIKTGVYFFTQALSEEEVEEEAQMLFTMMEGYDITCPVVVDVEKVADSSARMNELDPQTRTDLVISFCEKIEHAGYRPMIYFNTEMAIALLELERLEKYPKWYACYNDDFYYPYDYDMWQYSEKGKVDGIKTDVDLNIAFVPLWDE